VRTRAEFASFVNVQIANRGTEAKIPIPNNPSRSDNIDGTPCQHHYGRCELRALADFLYGDEAPTDLEKIK